MLDALAKRYLDGVDITDTLPETTGEILTRWIEWEYANLPESLWIEKSEKPDNYRSSKDLHNDILHNSHLFVFSLFCEHPLFSVETNQKFRAVHDYRHHYQSGVTEDDFGLYGEFCAWQKACDDLHDYLWWNESVPTLELYPILTKILFSEIVLQAAVKLSTGEFAEQKIVW